MKYLFGGIPIVIGGLLCAEENNSQLLAQNSALGLIAVLLCNLHLESLPIGGIGI
jgi:hypothetical protein